MNLSISERKRSQDQIPAAISELQDQMIELQMSMAHLEMTVEQLNQVITRQDAHIQTLQRQLQLVYKQVENQSPEESIAPFDVIADRPPHY
ncbi:SlyX family protein [uncultured Psychrobacter sp.]|uniref:SlyX family protein n=1 Tax=uncultured Psychrobacter sp. TaxID=259303 RepID=UPI00345997EF